MVNAKLEAQRKTIFHFWMNGIHSPKEIHEKTNIPLRTVENNLKKLKETGSIEHKGGNGRPSKVKIYHVPLGKLFAIILLFQHTNLQLNSK